MTYHFDSQAFVRRMEAAGMERRIAEELADALGSGVLDGLATRRDIDDSASRTHDRIHEFELKLKEIELRLTVRMGAMFAATIAILGALITFK